MGSPHRRVTGGEGIQKGLGDREEFSGVSRTELSREGARCQHAPRNEHDVTEVHRTIVARPGDGRKSAPVNYRLRRPRYDASAATTNEPPSPTCAGIGTGMALTPTA